MNLKELILRCGVLGLRAIYAPMKLHKTRNRITIISRQSNKPTMDIALLSNYINEAYPDIDCQVLARKLEGESKIGYAFHMLAQMKAMATSKVVVLDGYCIAASVLNHKPQTKIVQMWHALTAIKQFGYQTLDRPGGRSSAVANAMCMHRNYDYVISSSQVTAELFSKAFNTSMERFEFIGLPRIDKIVSDDETLIQRMTDKYKLDEIRKEGKKIILYVPTFRRGGEVKLGNLVRALDPDRYVLVVKLHPVYNDVEDVEDSNLKIIRDSSESSFDWLKVADRIVTDYSALGVEGTLVGKPMYFFLYDMDEYTKDVGLNINPTVELPQATARTSEEMRELLDREYDMRAMEAFREKYISVNTNNCTKQLGDFLYGIIKETS